MSSTVDQRRETIIPASRRPDGTMRKERRVRAGYVNQAEVPVYVPPHLKQRQVEAVSTARPTPRATPTRDGAAIKEHTGHNKPGRAEPETHKKKEWPCLDTAAPPQTQNAPRGRGTIRAHTSRDAMPKQARPEAVDDEVLDDEAATMMTKLSLQRGADNNQQSNGTKISRTMEDVHGRGSLPLNNDANPPLKTARPPGPDRSQC